MTEFWRRFLGIEDLVVPEGAHTRLELGGLPSSTWALGAVVLITILLGVVFWIYRREGEAPAWKRMSLAVVRCLVILTLALVLLEPNLVFDVERTLEATTVVLVDDSQSMSIRDRYDVEEAVGLQAATGIQAGGDRVPRSRVITGILRNEELRILDRLAEKNRLRIYSFSEVIAPIEWEASPPADTEAAGKSRGELPSEEFAPPRGLVTNLARGVRRALEDLGGRTASAVLILTDGKLNEGEPIPDIAGTLQNRGIPAHVIGIGNPLPPKNIRVDAILASERVFAKDPVIFEVHVSSQGLEGQRVIGELTRVEEGQDTEEVLESVEIELTGGEQSLRFRSIPDRAGRFRYSFRIPTEEGEVIEEDNNRSMRIVVVDDVIKILFIAGGPSFEYRFLKNLLVRDPTVQVSAWLQSADVDWLQEGNARIHRLPIKEEEFRAYDVIVMIDPDPLEIDVTWVRFLRAFVSDHGGGLLFIAGEKNTLNLLRSSAGEDWKPLLPVRPDLVAAERAGGFGKTYPDPWPIHVTPEGLDHAVGMLDKDRGKAEAIWRSLPGIYWHFPIAKGGPAATVLARHSDPRERGNDGLRPVLASQRYGAGRVVFSATDELWRWRSVAEEVYNRFWMQSIRYLVGGRLLGGKRRVTVLLDSDSYPLGKPIVVPAKILDRNYAPLESPEVAATLRGPSGDERPFPLHLQKGRPGNYSGIVIPSVPGVYEIRIGEGTGEVAVETITVELPNLEFQEPRMAERELRELAESTGGRYYTLSEVGEIPDAIPDRRETVLVSSAPTALWDSPAILAVLAGLLILEWFFRKRNQMA
ncbi:MAG: hypothetical protein O6952_02680 [Planctomycetota bacterium]|nr:hypothetical protein [Planctomycetota bacterium]